MVIPFKGEVGLDELIVRVLLLLIVIADEAAPLYVPLPMKVQLDDTCGCILIMLAPSAADNTNVPSVNV
jgi:hypothetical protein